MTSRRLIMDFMNGYNATTVVYGQTGTGKSYSMFGDSDASICGLTDRQRGLVPRACAEVFKAVADRQKLGITSTLAVTYIEIFGDFVSDLLRNGARVGQSQVASQRYVLSGEELSMFVQHVASKFLMFFLWLFRCCRIPNS